jgi:hypothetical protein
MSTNDTPTPPDGSTSVALGVEREGELIYLVFSDGRGVRPRFPLPAQDARALASLLLGAAKAVDPAGHQVILDQIGSMVAQHQLLAQFAGASN